MNKDQLLKISEVRAIAAMGTTSEVPYQDTELARKTMQAICQEASTYGLTTADVIRAILKPVFDKMQPPKEVRSPASHVVSLQEQ